MIEVTIQIQNESFRRKVNETDTLNKLVIKVYKICKKKKLPCPVQYWNQTKNRQFKYEEGENTLPELSIETGNILLVSTDYPENNDYNLSLEFLELEDEILDIDSLEYPEDKARKNIKGQPFRLVYPELAREQDQKPKCKLKLENKINSNFSDSEMEYGNEIDFLLKIYPVLRNIILEYGGLELAYSVYETHKFKNHFDEKAKLHWQVKNVIFDEWEKLTEKMQVNIIKTIDKNRISDYLRLNKLEKLMEGSKKNKFQALKEAFIEKNHAKFKLAYYYNKDLSEKEFSALWKKSYDDDEIHLDFIEQLLIFNPSYAKGCKIHDSADYALLQHACKIGAYKHVKLLSIYNADLVQRDIQLPTDNSLYLAVKASNLGIVEILLIHGAKITEDSIEAAKDLENGEILNLLEVNYQYPPSEIKFDPNSNLERRVRSITNLLHITSPIPTISSKPKRENPLNQIHSDISGEDNFINAAIQFKGAKFAEAYENFKLSAENQYPPAYLYLGLMNKFGMQSNQELTEEYFKKAEEMFPWFQIQAETHDAIAVQNMGLYYQYVEKNSPKARKWFDYADTLSHTKYPILLIALKEVCYWDKSVFSFTEKEIKLYQYLVSYDNAMAQYAIGMCYQYGIDRFSTNKEKAVNYFKKSAEQGYVPAQFRLGIRSLFDKNYTSQMMTKAWYDQALTKMSESRYLPMTGLVMMDIPFQHFVMHYGNFTVSETPDIKPEIKLAKTAGEAFRKGIICYSAGRYQQAINYFESSCAVYQPSLLYLLAIYTWEYSGSDKRLKIDDSFRKANSHASLFETLKQADDNLKTAEIQCYLGIYLAFCKDNEQVRKEMLSAFNKSVAAGYNMAEYLLGKFYYEGLRIEKNHELARHFLLQAAKKDNAPAQFFLSSHFLSSHTDDIALKNYWMRRAATLGHEIAILKIDPKLPKLKVSQAPSRSQKIINFSSLVPLLLEWWENETIIKKFVKSEEHKKFHDSGELKAIALSCDYDWVEAKEGSYSFFESVRNQSKYFTKPDEKNISSQELGESVLNELKTKKEFYLNKIKLSWIKFFNLADLISIHIIAHTKKTIIVIFCENTPLIVRPEGAKDVMVFVNIMGSFMQPLFPRSDLRLAPGAATTALHSLINRQKQEKNIKRKLEKNRKTKNNQRNRKKGKISFFTDGEGLDNFPLTQTSTSKMAPNS